MKTIEQLKAERAKLDKEISKMESDQHLAAIEKERSTLYTKVACASCDGLGVTFRNGSDNTDMDEWPCEDCREQGFLYARKWDGKHHRHSMNHNQVFPA